jgi:hypothetical protein
MGDEQVDIEDYVPKPNGTIEKALEQAAKDGAVRQGYRKEAAGGLQQALFDAMKDLRCWVQPSGENKHLKAKYATLKDILEFVRDPLDGVGVRIRQGVDRSYALDDHGNKSRIIIVYTDLIHVETGQVETTTVEIPVPRLDPQGMGSAITYGRRYSLLAALGLATDEADDDGDRATPKGIEAPSHSANLDALLASLEKAKAKGEAAALVEWKSDQKNITKYNRLSEGEQALLAAAYKKATDAIMADPA